MSYLSIDSFIEAFAAKLVQRGQRSVRLNEPRTRDNLLCVYELLEDEIKLERAKTPADKSRLRSLVNIQNIFRPSPVGAFDNFESLLRSKQDSLTEHPNPYYHDIVLRLSPASAKAIAASLDSFTADLVDKAVERYSGVELAR